MIRVLLYCEPAMLRSGLSLLLKGVPEITNFQVVGSLAELEAIKTAQEMLVLYQNDATTLDRVAPFLREITSLLVIREEEQQAGMDPRELTSTWGVVSTGISPEALRAAVIALSEHLVVVESTLSPKYNTLLLSETPIDEAVEQLTDRELAVLRKIAEGLTNKKIALDLGISENTVKFHVSALFSKLNATSRTDAVRIGARLGWVAL